MVLTTEQVIQIIKDNQAVPDWVKKDREKAATRSALFDGENFDVLLIEKIEKIENSDRALVRKKYSINIVDCYERLTNPIQNVFASTGSVKQYDGAKYQLTDADKQKLLDFVSNIRDGKSIERYIENKWNPVLHSDPSGVQWLVYESDDNGPKNPKPTYQSIGAIRNYIPKGQLVEWILFEPVIGTKANDAGWKYWTLVDDEMQYYIVQRSDTDIAIVDDPTKTFKHPFGEVPVIINSDITDKNNCRISPFEKAIDRLKEYARDQSIKTLYKILQGFPKHWRRAMFCAACKGTKKNGDGNQCNVCSGSGLMGKQDVSDDTLLPAELYAEDVKLSGDDIMGFVSPDLETLEHFTVELDWEEARAYQTIWGCEPQMKTSPGKDGEAKTATQIYQDKQPMINKLNKYADMFEWAEWKITEWLANLIDPLKPKNQNISLIRYGRRYIMEGVDTLQKKYEDAKKAGDTVGILDAIYQELLLVKFKNDPEWMRIELIKSRVEPYLHSSADEIFNRYGAKEAMKKDYFQQWWSDLPRTAFSGLDVEKKLELQFKTDFKTYLETDVQIESSSGALPPPANQDQQ